MFGNFSVLTYDFERLTEDVVAICPSYLFINLIVRIKKISVLNFYLLNFKVCLLLYYKTSK